jgi:Mg2+-importing ATPase
MYKTSTGERDLERLDLAAGPQVNCCGLSSRFSLVALQEVFQKDIVPGDVVLLSAGDVLPGDCRVYESVDLCISQSVLTGEALPVEKKARPDLADPPEQGELDLQVGALFQLPSLLCLLLSLCSGGLHFLSLLALSEIPSPLIWSITLRSTWQRTDLLFMGTNVVSGTAKATVIRTGGSSVFGNIALRLDVSNEPTSFEKGIKHLTYALALRVLCLGLQMSLPN